MSFLPEPEWEDAEPIAPELTVEWSEPQVIATLLSADGEPLLELLDRQPPGFCAPSP